MQPDKKKPQENRQDRNQQADQSSPGRDLEKENENVASAYQEASKDIDQDPDLSIHSPNDDLDESESVKLSGDKTDLV